MSRSRVALISLHSYRLAFLFPRNLSSRNETVHAMSKVTQYISSNSALKQTRTANVQPSQSTNFNLFHTTQSQPTIAVYHHRTVTRTIERPNLLQQSPSTIHRLPSTPNPVLRDHDSYSTPCFSSSMPHSHQHLAFFLNLYHP